MKVVCCFHFLTLLVLLVLTVPAVAQKEDGDYFIDPFSEEEISPDRPESMVLIDSGIVTKVLKSNLILLNNKHYKLDNISTPAYEDQLALNEVTSALLNRNVNVYSKTEDETIDRYRMPLTHVVRDDGVWIQERLISKGLAWATITGTNRQMTNILLKMEKEARDKRNGFWATPMYDIKTLTKLKDCKDCVDSYQIIEGKILYIKRKNLTLFLNFSKDWKTDFTIELPLRHLSRFKVHRPYAWLNRTVHVRGWVREKNGLMIEVKFPEQVEIIK